MSFRTGNAMRWSADEASTRKSMHSLARATDARRRAGSLKSERFFADAGQSQADYHEAEPEQPGPPRRPRPMPRKARPMQIHRRDLGGVLRSSDRRKDS